MDRYNKLFPNKIKGSETRQRLAALEQIQGAKKFDPRALVTAFDEKNLMSYLNEGPDPFISKATEDPLRISDNMLSQLSKDIRSRYEDEDYDDEFYREGYYKDTQGPIPYEDRLLPPPSYPPPPPLPPRDHLNNNNESQGTPSINSRSSRSRQSTPHSNHSRQSSISSTTTNRSAGSGTSYTSGRTTDDIDDDIRSASGDSAASYMSGRSRYGGYYGAVDPISRYSRRKLKKIKDNNRMKYSQSKIYSRRFSQKTLKKMSPREWKSKIEKVKSGGTVDNDVVTVQLKGDISNIMPGITYERTLNPKSKQELETLINDYNKKNPNKKIGDNYHNVDTFLTVFMENQGHDDAFGGKIGTLQGGEKSYTWRYNKPLEDNEKDIKVFVKNLDKINDINLLNEYEFTVNILDQILDTLEDDTKVKTGDEKQLLDKHYTLESEIFNIQRDEIEFRIKNKSSDFMVTIGKEFYDNLNKNSNYVQKLKSFIQREVTGLEFIQNNMTTLGFTDNYIKKLFKNPNDNPSDDADERLAKKKDEDKYIKTLHHQTLNNEASTYVEYLKTLEKIKTAVEAGGQISPDSKQFLDDYSTLINGVYDYNFVDSPELKDSTFGTLRSDKLSKKDLQTLKKDYNQTLSQQNNLINEHVINNLSTRKYLTTVTDNILKLQEKIEKKYKKYLDSGGKLSKQKLSNLVFNPKDEDNILTMILRQKELSAIVQRISKELKQHYKTIKKPIPSNIKDVIEKAEKQIKNTEKALDKQKIKYENLCQDKDCKKSFKDIEKNIVKDDKVNLGGLIDVLQFELSPDKEVAGKMETLGRLSTMFAGKSNLIDKTIQKQESLENKSKPASPSKKADLITNIGKLKSEYSTKASKVDSIVKDIKKIKDRLNANSSILNAQKKGALIDKINGYLQGHDVSKMKTEIDSIETEVNNPDLKSGKLHKLKKKYDELKPKIDAIKDSEYKTKRDGFIADELIVIKDYLNSLVGQYPVIKSIKESNKTDSSGKYEVVNKVNTEIRKHEQALRQYDTIRDAKIDELNKLKYKDFNTAISSINKGINSLSANEVDIKKLLDKLKTDINSIRNKDTKALESLINNFLSTEGKNISKYVEAVIKQFYDTMLTGSNGIVKRRDDIFKVAGFDTYTPLVAIDKDIVKIQNRKTDDMTKISDFNTEVTNCKSSSCLSLNIKSLFDKLFSVTKKIPDTIQIRDDTLKIPIPDIQDLIDEFKRLKGSTDFNNSLSKLTDFMDKLNKAGAKKQDILSKWSSTSYGPDNFDFSDSKNIINTLISTTINKSSNLKQCDETITLVKKHNVIMENIKSDRPLLDAGRVFVKVLPKLNSTSGPKFIKVNGDGTITINNVCNLDDSYEKTFGPFDIIQSNEKNPEVYDKYVKKYINGINNNTVKSDLVFFVYGLSGSGKSYTLFGDEKDRSVKGVVNLALKDLKNVSNVSVSSFQIYKKFILDTFKISEDLRKKKEDSYVIKGIKTGVKIDEAKEALDKDPDVQNDDTKRMINVATKNIKVNDKGIKLDENAFLELPFYSSLEERGDRSAVITDFNSLTERTGNLDKILDEIDSKRPVRKTTNNPASSRSHLFIIFNIKYKDGSSNKIVAVDTAGNESTGTGKGILKTEGVHITATINYMREYLKVYMRYGNNIPSTFAPEDKAISQENMMKALQYVLSFSKIPSPNFILFSNIYSHLKSSDPKDSVNVSICQDTGQGFSKEAGKGTLIFSQNLGANKYSRKRINRSYRLKRIVTTKRNKVQKIIRRHRKSSSKLIKRQSKRKSIKRKSVKSKRTRSYKIRNLRSKLSN